MLIDVAACRAGLDKDDAHGCYQLASRGALVSRGEGPSRQGQGPDGIPAGQGRPAPAGRIHKAALLDGVQRSRAPEHLCQRHRQGGRLRAGFVAGLPFELDRFQLEAIDALDEGRSVVVAAPTGSGKTVVAEYAVARALAEGGKAFYTTPLKALSNQKFADFSRRLGAAQVGLLTGDNSINGDAPVVVMTTEVLRNMVYAGSACSRGPALRRARRGPLPPGPLPWPGLGGSHHPPGAGGRPGLPVGHRFQRRRTGGLGRHGARLDQPPSSRSAGPSRCETCCSSVSAPVVEAGAGTALGKGSQARPAGRSGRRGRLALLPTFVDGRPNPEAWLSRQQPRGLAGQAPLQRSVRPPAVRDSGAAGRRGHAAGDLFHLQPGRVRRGGAPVLDERPSPDQCPGAPPGPCHRRGGDRPPLWPRPLGPRLRQLAGRPRGGLRGPPRRPGAAVQGSGRALLLRRARQGRLRHRDPVARRQHAGPFRGDRKARPSSAASAWSRSRPASTPSSRGVPGGAAPTRSATPS